MGKIRKILNWCNYNRRGVSVILSIIALILSSISICYVFQRDGQPPFDYQGIFVAIFSLLVTLLIGWNILTAIKVDRDIVETTKKIAIPLIKLEADINYARIFYNFAISYMRRDGPLLLLLIAYINGKAANDKEVVESCKELIDNEIKLISDSDYFHISFEDYNRITNQITEEDETIKKVKQILFERREQSAK